MFRISRIVEDSKFKNNTLVPCFKYDNLYKNCTQTWSIILNITLNTLVFNQDWVLKLCFYVIQMQVEVICKAGVMGVRCVRWTGLRAYVSVTNDIQERKISNTFLLCYFYTDLQFIKKRSELYEEIYISFDVWLWIKITN